MSAVRLGKTNLPAKIALTLFLGVCAAALFSLRVIWVWASYYLVFALPLLGLVVMCLRLKPSWASVLWIFVLGAGVAGEICYREHLVTLYACMSSLGLGAMLLLAIHAVWEEGERRRQFLWGFTGALLLMLWASFGLRTLQLTQNASSKVLDLYLYSFDSSLHVNLAFLVARAFLEWRWLGQVGSIVYLGLFIPMAVVYGGQLSRSRRTALQTLAAFLVTCPLGLTFYHLFPALGPVHVLRNFPWDPLTYQQASRLVLEPVFVPGLRNAMPSLHMAWALLTWWYSKRLSWLERSIVMLFAIFTAASTMGVGEHYFVDLIVAFPFALMIMGLCAFDLPWQNAARLRAFYYGLLATLAWIVALRYEIRVFWLSPVIPWAACGATVALAIFLERRLQQADSMGTEESASDLRPAISCESPAREARIFQA